MNLKEYIIEKSKILNIDMIGFTDSAPLYNVKKHLNYRLENNLQTEFEEKEVERRIDPKLTFPSCKSIIVIALSYNVDFEITNDNKLKGALSKSSWGLDYHRVLKAKMKSLIEEIKDIEDFDYKMYVDTGPLVERELANKAGIGYYGKNCSIINDEYGSFIFIGYIMTDLDIEADTNRVYSKCGDCDLCIRACPTNALEPYKLNPKKCISYLTQTKDIIPIEYRKKINSKIYGCDTCQLVCPKNKDVKPSVHLDFIPYNTGGYMDIIELLSMSNSQFKRKYGSMSGAWRGKNILKRNAIIALGNMKVPENSYLLKNIDSNNSSYMEEYIKWAMENIFLTK